MGIRGSQDGIGTPNWIDIEFEHAQTWSYLSITCLLSQSDPFEQELTHP